MRRDMQLIADVILTLDRIRCFGFGLTPFYPDSLQEPLHVQGDFMDARFAADRIRRYYSAIVDSPVIYPPLTNFFVAVVIGLYREDAVLGCSMVEYVTKSNPYHDEKGRFCSPSEAVTVSGTPGSERTADSAPPVSSLTEGQKEEYKKKLQCSDEVMSYIRTAEEADVYVKAGLREAIVNNRRCLVREIDPYFKKGHLGSNNELMLMGKSPYSIDREKIILHHIGQRDSSPFAELTEYEHRSCTYILHVMGDGREGQSNFDAERKQHWKNRTENFHKSES